MKECSKCKKHYPLDAYQKGSRSLKSCIYCRQKYKNQKNKKTLESTKITNKINNLEKENQMLKKELDKYKSMYENLQTQIMKKELMNYFICKLNYMLFDIHSSSIETTKKLLNSDRKYMNKYNNLGLVSFNTLYSLYNRTSENRNKICHPTIQKFNFYELANKLDLVI